MSAIGTRQLQSPSTDASTEELDAETRWVDSGWGPDITDLLAQLPSDRAERVDALCGSMAGMGLSVDDFLREKHAELEAETER